MGPGQSGTLKPPTRSQLELVLFACGKMRRACATPEGTGITFRGIICGEFHSEVKRGDKSVMTFEAAGALCSRRPRVAACNNVEGVVGGDPSKRLQITTPSAWTALGRGAMDAQFALLVISTWVTCTPAEGSIAIFAR
jgi:hypothetical protein